MILSNQHFAFQMLTFCKAKRIFELLHVQCFVASRFCLNVIQAPLYMLTLADSLNLGKSTEMRTYIHVCDQ